MKNKVLVSVNKRKAKQLEFLRNGDAKVQRGCIRSPQRKTNQGGEIV